MDESFKKSLYNLLQPSNKVTVLYRNEQELSNKEVLIIVRVFNLEGTEIDKISGLFYSQSLKAHFNYLPEGISINYVNLLDLEFDELVSSIRVEFIPWVRSKGKVLEASTISCQILAPVTHDQTNLHPIAVGVFESIEKEII